MTKFHETAEAAAFIATADTRETSTEVMRAIAFFAESAVEAEMVWNGDMTGICNPSDIWEHATNNGLIQGDTLFWGGVQFDRAIAELVDA